MGAVIPFYFKGSAGQLFALKFPAKTGSDRLPTLLFLPPFAEEMNRTRHVFARLGRAYAAAGGDLILLDLFGAGDSEGAFEEARFETWVEDSALFAASLAADGRPLAIGGARLGAGLAAEVASRAPGRFAGLVLWQPVADGKTYLRQLLRIRVAADLAERGKAEHDTKELLAELDGGRPVEIAGYDLTPAMAAGLGAFSLAPLGERAQTVIDWFEVSSDETAPLSPAATRMLETWRAQGVRAEGRMVAGEQVWSLPVRAECDGLVAATVGAMERRR